MQLGRFNLFSTVLLLLFIFLQFRLWFESDGIIDMMRLKKRLATEQHINGKLKNRNENLSTQVQQLKKNQDAIELRARQELGMIKKDETFYQVIK